MLPPQLEERSRDIRNKATALHVFDWAEVRAYGRLRGGNPCHWQRPGMSKDLDLCAGGSPVLWLFW